MKIACLLTPFDSRNLTLASQIGVEEIVSVFPGTELGNLLRIRDQVEAAGMRLTTIERLIPHHKVVHRIDGYQQQIEVFQTLIQNMAAAGLSTLCYNWMPSEDWHRTSIEARERGGALVAEFDMKGEAAIPRSEEHDVTKVFTSAEKLWENLQLFQEEIVPVAEEYGINLAIHPDDPPIELIGEQAQIITTPDALRKAVELVPSPRNGICFCQGSMASRGDIDLPEAIADLAEYIKFVHFRDVVGSVPSFRESFHDNGKTDMAACWRAYEKAGLTEVPIRPDHVPTMAGESNGHPGYEMQGRLFAIGFMKGLQASVNLPGRKNKKGTKGT